MCTTVAEGVMPTDCATSKVNGIAINNLRAGFLQARYRYSYPAHLCFIVEIPYLRYIKKHYITLLDRYECSNCCGRSSAYMTMLTCTQM